MTGVRGWIRRYRVRLLAALGLSVWVLGLAGYLRAGSSVADSIYEPFKLFSFSFSEPESGDVPAILQIARFAAPVITAGAAFSALAALLRDEVDGLRARRMKGHVIICGAGERGRRFALDFLGAGGRVLVIEKSRSAEAIESLRQRGIPVLIGDATDRLTLERANASHAERIVVVLRNEDRNAAVVSALDEIPAERDPQVVHAHVNSPALETWLTSRSIEHQSGKGGTEARHVEWFNLDRLAAGILLSEHFGSVAYARDRVGLIDTEGDLDPARGIAIAGVSGLTQSLVIEAAQIWREQARSAYALPAGSVSAPDTWPRLSVTVVDEHASGWVDYLKRSTPGLDHALDLTAVDRPPGGGGLDPSSVDVVYVTADTSVESLEIGYALEAARTGNAQIVVRVLVDVTHLARAMGIDRNTSTIQLVNVLDRTCTVDLIEHSLVQRLAMENHALYHGKVRHQPASIPWDELDERNRTDNVRAAIDHLQVKIPMVDGEVVPIESLTDVRPTLQLSDEDVEKLARHEHDRWWESRKADGWTFGKVRDNDRKRHPDMVPWEELGGEEEPGREERRKEKQDLDRMFIYGLPMMLNACGYRLVKAERSPQPEA